MFRSLAQRRYLFAKDPELAQKYAADTPPGTVLPDKVKTPSVSQTKPSAPFRRYIR